MEQHKNEKENSHMCACNCVGIETKSKNDWPLANNVVSISFPFHFQNVSKQERMGEKRWRKTENFVQSLNQSIWSLHMFECDQKEWKKSCDSLTKRDEHKRKEWMEKGTVKTHTRVQDQLKEKPTKLQKLDKFLLLSRRDCYRKIFCLSRVFSSANEYGFFRLFFIAQIIISSSIKTTYIYFFLAVVFRPSVDDTR